MSAPLQSVRPQPSCNDHTPRTVSNNFDLYKPAPCPEPKCSCSCGCLCCSDKSKDNENTNDTPSPARGRSNTPKYDRTNGKGRPHPGDQASSPGSTSRATAISSIDGQEGLAGHQRERHAPIEVGDLGTHAHDAIQHWLEQHQLPTHPYGFPSTSGASMLVEASTVASSLAASGFLPRRIPSSADLFSFATGGFDDGDNLRAHFTPVWLTYERRYCRGCQLGRSVGVIPIYPATIDVFGIE